jgi:hypothetical protein
LSHSLILTCVRRCQAAPSKAGRFTYIGLARAEALSGRFVTLRAVVSCDFVNPGDFA